MKFKEHKLILQGEKVILHPMTEGDWDILLKWNSDSDVLFFTEGNDVGSSSLTQVQEICRHITQNALCFIIEVAGNQIGECWLQQMNLERIFRKYPGLDCRRIDLMIGEKAFWGQGLGTEVIRLLTIFAFEQEGADLVFGCDIAGYNLASHKAFQKIGYQVDTEIPQSPNSKARYRYDLVLKRELGINGRKARMQR